MIIAATALNGLIFNLQTLPVIACKKAAWIFGGAGEVPLHLGQTGQIRGTHTVNKQ